MKFNDLYKLVLEEAKAEEDSSIDTKITERVAAFKFYKEYEEVFNKFKARLQAELDKVKKKDPRLADVELAFEGNDFPDDDGQTVMSVEHRWPTTILVNLQPFVLQYDGTEESFEDAIVDYYFNATNGEHIIQHECAHVLDLIGPDRPDKYENDANHDEVFREIQRRLDSIEPHLDEP